MVWDFGEMSTNWHLAMLLIGAFVDGGVLEARHVENLKDWWKLW